MQFHNLLIFIVFSFYAQVASGAKVGHFGEAKPLLSLIYKADPKTFYCGCAFQQKSIKKCDVTTQKFKKRRYRLEWEHVVPAHAFGQSFIEWREAKKLCPRKKKKYISSRKCARKLNKTFRIMEADLHNLVPVVGSINALRSNYSFAELSPGIKPLCASGFRLDNRKVMPPDSKKGDIARIYFYMNQQYPGHGVISSKNEKLFSVWSKLDPVDSVECDIYFKKLSFGANKILSVEEACKKLKVKND